MTILTRYLVGEVVRTWVAVTAILLVILLSNRFARFLGQAASGKLPESEVFQLLGLAAVQLLGILVPIAFFLAILLALGRLYRDSEMAALAACGAEPGRILRAVYLAGLPVAALVAWLSLWAGPQAAATSARVERQAGQQAELEIFEPGRFKRISRADTVFYSERRSENGLSGVFIRSRSADQPVVITARRAEWEREGGGRILRLFDGARYEGVPGRVDFRIVEFEEHGIRVDTKQEAEGPLEVDNRPTAELLASDRPADRAELQWRIALPVATVIMTLIAVPLSRTSPRQGRYGKLFAGILVYVIYSNLMGVAQVWVEKSVVPPLPGLHWVHAVMLAFGLVLFGRQAGWFAGRARKEAMA